MCIRKQGTQGISSSNPFKGEKQTLHSLPFCKEWQSSNKQLEIAIYESTMYRETFHDG